MIYTTLFLIGLLGLLAQAFLGLSHGGHDGAAGHGGHAGGHSHGGHAGGHSSENGHGSDRGPSPLWTLLSPLTLFSVCLGAGATGL